MRKITMYGLTPSKQINYISGELPAWRAVLHNTNQLPDYVKSNKLLVIYINNYDPANINFLVKYIKATNFKTDLDVQYIKNCKLNRQEYFEYQRRFDKQEFLREIARDSKDKKEYHC